MKIFLAFVATAILFICFSAAFPTPALALPDITLGIGYNSDCNAVSLLATNLFDYPFAVEIGLMFGWDYSDALDYPCPHYDYIILNDHNLSTAGGIDILTCLDIGDSLRVYVGAGLYLVFYNEIAMSNVTGWTYIQSESMEVELAYSCGIMFDGFGVSYHSIRGVSVNFISLF